MKTLFLFLLASGTSLAAQPKRYPFDSATCKLAGKSFEVRLETIYKPGDPENDSGGAQFVQVGGKEAEKRTGKFISDGAYTFLKPEEGSLCDKTQAYAVGGKLAAVLYLEDN